MAVVIDLTANPPIRPKSDLAEKPRHPEKAHRPDAESPRKPDWIRVRAPTSRGYSETHKIVKENGLVTVCEEAGCPNIGECWDKKHATFMIMGDTCTRACSFCNVKTGMPGALDAEEPEHVARSRRQARPLACRHHLGRSRRSRRRRRGAFRADHPRDPRAVPDHDHRDADAGFSAQGRRARSGGRAKPDVFNHNLETVPSLYLTVRPGARYFHSIRLLQRVKELDPTMFTKSGIMVGLGEERNEVLQVMDDLRSADVDFLTIGQYLQPTTQASCGDALRHAGRVQELRDDGLHQGLPDGVGIAADALVAPRGRGFRQAEGGARGSRALRPMPQFSTKRRVRAHRCADVRPRRRCRALSGVRAVVPGAEGAHARAAARWHRESSSPT